MYFPILKINTQAVFHLLTPTFYSNYISILFEPY